MDANWLYIGQRVSDLLNLKPIQLRFIENGVYIDINQQKTDKYVTVGVVDKEVIQILKQRFLMLFLLNYSIDKLNRFAR